MRRIGAVLAAALLGMLGLTAPAAAQPSCAEVTLLAVPGTGEITIAGDPERSYGTLAAVTDPLEERFSAAELSVLYVPYPAAGVAPRGFTYFDSQRQGVNNTVEMINGVQQRCSGTTFLLLGYSQGADVAGDVGNRIGTGRGPIPASAFGGMALVGGPQFDPGAGLVYGSAPGDTEGVLGARPAGFGSVSDRTVQVCIRKDWVCDPNSRNLFALLAQSRNGQHSAYGSTEFRSSGRTYLESLTRTARASIERGLE